MTCISGGKNLRPEKMQCERCPEYPQKVRRYVREQGKPISQLPTASLHELLQLIQENLQLCAGCPATRELLLAKKDLEQLADALQQVLQQRLPSAPQTPALPSVPKVPAVCKLCTDKTLRLDGKEINRYLTLSSQELRALTPGERKTLRTAVEQSLKQCKACTAGCGKECDADLIKRAQHRTRVDALTLDRLQTL